MKTKHKLDFIYYLYGIALIFVIWFAISEFAKYSFIFPKINDVFKELGSIIKTGKTYLLLLKLIIGIVLSITISFFISFILASTSYLNNSFKKAISPIITLFKVLPSITILVYLKIVFYHQLLVIPYILTFLMIIPILYEGMDEAFNSIDNELVMDIKLNSPINYKIIFKYFLKIKKLTIISLFLQVSSLSLKIFIMSQIITGIINSIGYNIATAASFFETETVFAWTIILVVIGLLIDIILKVSKETIKKGVSNE